MSCPSYSGREKALVDLNTVTLGPKSGLTEYLAKIKDPRKPRGVRHSQVTVLAVAICAFLSGAKSFIGIGEWAANLSQELLKRLGCRYNDRLKKYVNMGSEIIMYQTEDGLTKISKAHCRP